MCPSCMATTSALIAAVGSAGGVVALFIVKFRDYFTVNDDRPFKTAREKQR